MIVFREREREREGEGEREREGNEAVNKRSYEAGF